MINRAREKGFTLVELMIVVAVIALLILVLVPRIGLIKNKSREAGIRANMTMLEGAIQSVIDDYTTSAADMSLLEKRVIADINAADSTTNQIMKNPVTGATGAAAKNTVHTGTSAAITYLDDGDGSSPVDQVSTAGGAADTNWPSNASSTDFANAKGVIAIAAYANSGKINVKLIPYGPDGKRIDKLIKTIGQ